VRLRFASVLVALALTLVGAVVAQPASAATLFSDDFTGAKGAKPNASKWSEWSSCTYNGSAAYGNIKCGERATLDGQGHLVIPASPDQGTSISTKDHFRAVTGTFTARMKISSEPGYWPAFWMLNNNPNGVDRAKIGEVDALEAYTALKPYYHVAVHNWKPEPVWSGAADPACGEGVILDQWHDYSTTVTNTHISFAIDGVQCGPGVDKSEANGRPWNFGTDNPAGLWMILTNAVGGAGGQQDGKAVKPSSLLVDRVSVTR
jgi:hypothetical protein